MADPERIFQLIQKLAREYGINDERIHIAGDKPIPPKKLKNALSVYNRHISPKYVFVLVDDTVLGGGKDGFIITEEHIAIHELFSDPVIFRLDDVETIQSDGGKLYLNDRKVFSGYMPEKSELHKLYKLLLDLLKILADDRKAEAIDDYLADGNLEAYEGGEDLENEAEARKQSLKNAEEGSQDKAAVMCAACGTKSAPGTNFCPNCGASLKNLQKENSHADSNSQEDSSEASGSGDMAGDRESGNVAEAAPEDDFSKRAEEIARQAAARKAAQEEQAREERRKAQEIEAARQAQARQAAENRKRNLESLIDEIWSHNYFAMRFNGFKQNQGKLAGLTLGLKVFNFFASDENAVEDGSEIFLMMEILKCSLWPAIEARKRGLLDCSLLLAPTSSTYKLLNYGLLMSSLEVVMAVNGNQEIAQPMNEGLREIYEKILFKPFEQYDEQHGQEYWQLKRLTTNYLQYEYIEPLQSGEGDAMDRVLEVIS